MEGANSSLNENEAIKLVAEAESIWKIDLDVVPDRDYVKSKERNWKYIAPKINKEDFTTFGWKIINIIKDDLLRRWIMDRMSLFACLIDNHYPRPLQEEDDRSRLIMSFSKDEEELNWAAVWLIWKRVGGLLEAKEEDHFRVEVNGNIPKEYQELQRLNREEANDFLKGNTGYKLRIAELGNENMKIIDWLGRNNLMITRSIDAIRRLGQQFLDLKELEKLKDTYKRWEIKFTDLEKDTNELKRINANNDLKSQVENIKSRVDFMEDRGFQFKSFNSQWRRGYENSSLVIRKLDFLTRSQKRLEKNFNYWKSLQRKKKNNARRFFEVRRKKKESKKEKLPKRIEKIVEEADSSDKENSSVGSNSVKSPLSI